MRTLSDLQEWLAQAPDGASVTLSATKLAALLRDGHVEPPPPSLSVEPPAIARESWRTLLWTAPADTRIGRAELLEAVGRKPSWLYRHTSAKRTAAGVPRIPHRKIDGELTFVVGEVRQWLRDHERIIEAGPTDGKRRLRAIR